MPADTIWRDSAGARRIWWSAAAFALAYGAARFALKLPELATPARVTVALVPVAAFAWFALNWIRAIRALDELERRVQLEALAFAFPTFMLLLMLLGMLQLVTVLDSGNWSYRHVWAFMPVLYFVGLFLARRRYQ